LTTVSIVSTTQISEVTKVTTVTVPLTITSVQELTKTTKETTTLVATETKFVTSTQTIEDVRLRELLERINRTTFENVDRYVRSVAPGWTAQQMAHDLEDRDLRNRKDLLVQKESQAKYQSGCRLPP
jgi:hypothetical protein